MNLAAVDIGTNSVRLYIAARDPESGRVDALVRRAIITRLGAGVDARGELQPEAIERTLDALREYANAIAAHEVQAMRAVATSAVRDAANRDAFVAEVQAVLGVTPEILAGEAEARLSFAGAVGALAPSSTEPRVVFDIGGGSTELIVGGASPDALVSLDVGCVRITERFLDSDPPAPEELSNAVGYVRDLLSDAERLLPGARGARPWLAVDGTSLTAAAIDLVLDPYDPTRTHGHVLTRAAAEAAFREMATASAEERLDTPGLEPARVGVIVGGLIVLVSILRHFDLPAVVTSEADILDGIIGSIQP